MKQNAPGQIKAQEYLQQLAQSKTAHPSIATMAREVGISYVTMWKAVKGFGKVQAGTARSNHALHRNCPIEHFPAAHEYIAGKIDMHIIAGKYPISAPLPSISELQQIYGAGYRTLKQALLLLCEKDVIRKSGRQWHQVRRVNAKTDPTIVLIKEASYTDSLTNNESFRQLAFLYAFQQECHRLSIKLRIVTTIRNAGIFQFTPSFKSELLKVNRAEVIMGYVIWNYSLNAEALDTISSSLQGVSQPVVMLDENGDIEHWFLQHIKVFTMANSSVCGEHAGRYLRELGHRKIAWGALGTEKTGPSSVWSRRRLDGLTQGFGVHRSNARIFPFYIGLPDSESLLMKMAQQVQNNVEMALAAPPGDQIDFENSSLLHRITYDAICAAMLDTYMPQKLTSVIKELLSNEKITAIVAESDRFALACMKLLQSGACGSQGRNVHVMGFDDSPEAYKGELTSYNFNVRDVASAITGYILRPPREKSGRITEIPGYIITRKAGT